MGEFFNWLSSNPAAGTTFLVGAGLLFLAITAIFLIAFRQGREITFWPPSIGPRTPERGGSATSPGTRPNRLDEILRLEGSVVIARSVIQGEGKRYVRDPDAQVTGRLTEYFRGEIVYEEPMASLDRPASHLIVVGSPRYNAHAELVQKSFNLPWQFVKTTVGAEPAASLLKIVTEYGEVLGSSVDHGMEGSREAVDYGILFIGNLSQGKRVFWIGGIHGVGTSGVFRYLWENSHAIRNALSPEEDTGTCWLIRVKYLQAEDGRKPTIIDLEALGDPKVCARHTWARRPKALISDLGNVIMFFDRSRTYRAIAHILDVPHEGVKSQIERTTLREQYEVGEISDQQFLDSLMDVVGARDTELTLAFLQEFWGDIFWPNREMISALHQIKESRLVLVLLSNTNPIHFAHVLKDYPELERLFDEFVLSYEVGVAKPDRAIFARAIEAVVDRFEGARMEDLLFVDDKPEFVRIAENLGMKGHIYRSHPHFVFWLRQMGVYLP